MFSGNDSDNSEDVYVELESENEMDNNNASDSDDSDENNDENQRAIYGAQPYQVEPVVADNVVNEELNDSNDRNDLDESAEVISRLNTLDW